MKKLNAPDHSTDLLQLEPNYPLDRKNVYVEGYYGAESESGTEKQLLRSVLSTLHKHWFLILSFNLCATAAAIVYVAQKPDYYKAIARVQVNAEINPAAGSGNRSNGGSVIVNNAGTDPAYFTTQLQILEGAGLLRRVAKKLDLEHNQSFLDPQRGRELSVWQNVERMFGWYHPSAPQQTALATLPTTDNKLNLAEENSLDPNAESEKYAPVIRRLKSSLTVMPVKDSRTSNKETRLIDIDFVHQDPLVAAKIANAIGDAYVFQNLEQKVQTNASAGDFLQKRVAELQSEIRLGEEQLINYSKNNQIVSLDAAQNTVVQRFSDLSMRLGQAENERIAAQAAYQAALQNQMRAAAAETKDGQVSALENKLNDLRQKLAQLKTQYTDEWFEVAETRKQIERVENQLLTMRKRASDIQLAALEEKLNETVAREKNLRNNFETQRSEVIRQNEASINYKIIQQEIDTNKSLLAGLLQRSRENDVILNGTPNNVLVADRAIVPRSPVGPGRARNVLLAFVVSLLAGFGIGFLLDWLDDSVRNSDDIETNLGLPLLALVPAAQTGFGNRLMPQNLFLRHRKRRDTGLCNLKVFDKPDFSEAYLQLQTHLMLSTAGGAPQTILITSGVEGEGKTLTAINLAQSLAKTGNSILLVDGDLRCPRVHLIKELSNQSGLTTLLTAKNVNDELIEKTILKNGCGNLHVLTAGEHTATPANLLWSPEMRQLLMDLSTRYTHIVIDSPPVLYFADSTILSTLVDAVIIVVRDNASSRQAVLKAKKTLQNVGARIVGMVINGVPAQWSNYSKYRNYERPDELPPAENGYQILNLH